MVHTDGLDLALISLSSPIGVEALTREHAQELIDAHLDGVLSLGDEFAAWGPLALDEVNPDDVDDLLGRGCVGISLPAGALAGYDMLDDLGPVLERVAERGVPLLVHPGPGREQAVLDAALTDPLWWQALTGYVAQMHSAWLSFVTRGRKDHPSLMIVFAMLAGGAPLLSERLASRGGPAFALDDPLVLYDTSSYGPAAIEALARRVGADHLVYGSDRPVIEPIRTGRDRTLRANGARLLARTQVGA